MDSAKKKPKILSAGVVVLRRDGEAEAEWLLLLLRAYQYWDFPKGMVEAGESALQGAIREVEEETTINDLRFNWGHRYRETGPYRNGKVARYYMAETTQSDVSLPIVPELGRAEHHEFRWVSFDEALRIVSPRVRSVIRWVKRTLDQQTK